MRISQLNDALEFHDGAIVDYSQGESWIEIRVAPSEAACDALSLSFGSTVVCHFSGMQGIVLDGTLEFGEEFSNEILAVHAEDYSATFEVDKFTFATRAKDFVRLTIRADGVEIFKVAR